MLWSLIAVLSVTAVAAGVVAWNITLNRESGRFTTTSTSYTPTGTLTQVNGTLILKIKGTEYHALRVGNDEELINGVSLGGVYFREVPVTVTGCSARVIAVIFPDGYSRNLTAVYSCTSTPLPEWLQVVRHAGVEAGVYQRNGTLYLVEREVQGGP